MESNRSCLVSSKWVANRKTSVSEVMKKARGLLEDAAAKGYQCSADPRRTTLSGGAPLPWETGLDSSPHTVPSFISVCTLENRAPALPSAKASDDRSQWISKDAFPYPFSPPLGDEKDHKKGMKMCFSPTDKILVDYK